MPLHPANAAELSRALADAFARRRPPGPVDLSALNRVVEHAPEDMTVTVQAGLTLAALQAELKGHHQWLPLDPPHPERRSLAAVIDGNLTGPRRYGCGTIRDYLIGLQVVLADGAVVRSGGRVVKNVAGYDLARLFIGAAGSLGVVLEATFKLRPLPESERFAEKRCASLTDAARLLESVFNSELTPVALDLHNLSGLPTVVAGFAGTREEVDWQSAVASQLGFTGASSLDHEAKFWSSDAPVHRVSVLPEKIVEALTALGGAEFVARAGNGIVYHRGPAAVAGGPLPLQLIRRVKDAFDPRGIFPGPPLSA